MKKEYYPEINIARGLGVLIVLLGHSFPDAEVGVFAHPFFQWGYDTCYSFHMALFFVISGFVLGKRFYQGDYSYRSEMIGKIKRLLIPYLFLSYLSLLPKIILNAYARNPVDTTGAVKVPLGQSPNGSLWYLYTLFLFSVFALGCGKKLRNCRDTMKSICMLLGGGVCYLIFLCVGEMTLQCIFLDRIFKYFVFFVLGLLMNRYYADIKKWFFWPAALLCGGLVIVFAWPYLPVRIDYGITAILGTYGVLVVSKRIADRKESRICKMMDQCGEHSYDIYILSYYIQQTIRVVCFRILGWDYVLVFILELVLGFTISYLFSQFVLRKNKMLKRVLIGVWEN